MQRSFPVGAAAHHACFSVAICGAWVFACRCVPGGYGPRAGEPAGLLPVGTRLPRKAFEIFKGDFFRQPPPRQGLAERSFRWAASLSRAWFACLSWKGFRHKFGHVCTTVVVDPPHRNPVATKIRPVTRSCQMDAQKRESESLAQENQDLRSKLEVRGGGGPTTRDNTGRDNTGRNNTGRDGSGGSGFTGYICLQVRGVCVSSLLWPSSLHGGQ